ncbi:hypothetical protein MNV49_007899 [Pseudohyphozyma bogoriensis]|nr:hypothetical protein MNV49_007899 [Pseudohyphozyma bogoriensis]
MKRKLSSTTPASNNPNAVSLSSTSTNPNNHYSQQRLPDSMAPYSRGGGRGGGGGRHFNQNKRQRGGPAPQPVGQIVNPPVHDLQYINQSWAALGGRGPPNAKWIENAKGVIANYCVALGESAKYNATRVRIGTWDGYRCTVVADPSPPPPRPMPGQPSLPPVITPIIGTGDGPNAKEAEKLAALHACFQLGARGLFTSTNLPTRTKGMVTPLHAASTGGAGGGGGMAFPEVVGSVGGNDGKTVGLSNGVRIGLEEARAFMDYYCQRFNFGKPDLQYHATQPTQRSYGRSKASSVGSWTATLFVTGRRIGMGEARSKKEAQNRAYLDTASYLEDCDPDLWASWVAKKKESAMNKAGVAPYVQFQVDPRTDEELRETVWESRDSQLYKRARAMLERERQKAEEEKERLRQRAWRGGADAMDVDDVDSAATAAKAQQAARRAEARKPMLEQKSKNLLQRLTDYQTDPRVEKIRNQRNTLPVHSHASSVLAKIATSSVVVVLAATGSGKTTQLPQLILDDWILRGDGAKCNIVCTQPRRIAAISVAERVAKERGEAVGDSVGYQVRFESKPPRPDGNILFCTTGLFLRRLQSDLNHSGGGESFLDGVTHVAVDEVHERDVDTDLLLFVLRRLLHERRKQGKPEIKVVLMSATIDPTLFTNYFADPDTGRLAPVVEVPGRSFPVDKHFLDETVQELQHLRLPPNQGGWVFSEKSVAAYLNRELVPKIPIDPHNGKPIGEIDDLDMPYPLISLIIAYVLSKSDEGHVLVFLPGWEEIQAVRNILIDRNRYPLLDINFNDSQYEIHVLHSTIPIAEQNAVFEPPAAGIRRIVLSTNIAETSVTIPDVVFVVDSAKCKEKRYDPERRLSQLVSAWTGTSNVLQRAGRAGRHRAGEYYGIVSKARFDAMEIHQTVEMLRTDLANTCMHITGLHLPGLSVEDVLSATIQPPERARVHAAMFSLKMVGAIDRDEKLTSLGRVLLQLPVEAAIGKLCLLGSFFRCLEQTLTLAAILTNRDPFLSPPLMKEQADRVKNSWTPTDFRSDPFAVLQAFNAWWAMQSRGEFVAANNFARENFLSKPTLLMIQKIKEHLLQSLDKAGVLRISAGGTAAPPLPFRRGGTALIPESLNVNGNSLPLLSALIATAVAPNFAIRVSEKSLRTSQDKSCAIHPSSVNSRKNEKANDLPVVSSKQIYAFGEKSKTGALGSTGGQMFLRSTTKLDPLGYMLFGAFHLRVMENGLECDNWLPIQGNVSALDDVERLKDVLDLSLLRVFEGLGVQISKGRQQASKPQNRRGHVEDEEGEGEADQEAYDLEDPTLSATEVSDLDNLTTGVVKVLNMYAASRGESSSSRPDTPAGPGGQYRTGLLSQGPQGGHGRGFPASMPATRTVSPRDTPFNSRPGSSAGGYGNGGIPPMVTVSAPLTHTSSWSLAYLDLAVAPQTLVGGPETLPPSEGRDATVGLEEHVEQREAIAKVSSNIAAASTATSPSSPLSTEQKHILFCAIILCLVEGVVKSYFVSIRLRESGSTMDPIMLSRVLRREHDEMIYAYFKNDWSFAKTHPNRPYYEALHHGFLPACLVEANYAASLWMSAHPSRTDLVLARLQEPFSLSQLPEDVSILDIVPLHARSALFVWVGELVKGEARRRDQGQDQGQGQAQA